jgi:hypothetical protein
MAARKADHPLQRYETRGRSALLPPVTYTTCWDTILIGTDPSPFADHKRSTSRPAAMA